MANRPWLLTRVGRGMASASRSVYLKIYYDPSEYGRGPSR